MEPIFWIWATLFTLLFGDFNHFPNQTYVDYVRIYLYMDDYIETRNYGIDKMLAVRSQFTFGKSRPDETRHQKSRKQTQTAKSI